jgi:hypothetical protein
LESVVRCAEETIYPIVPTYSTTCAGGSTVVAFDVSLGWLGMGNGAAGGSSEIRVRDRFAIFGPPAGSPVTIRLRARIVGEVLYGVCCDTVRIAVALRPLEPEPGELESKGELVRAESPTGVFTFSDSLDLVLERTSELGVGLEIGTRFDVPAGSAGQFLVRYTFVDIPPGAEVRSCKGYRQSAPVPAFARTWGSLKASYR